MAKSTDYLPSQAEVDDVLYCKKQVDFTGVRWGDKPPPNKPFLWLQMNLLPIDSDGIPIQGLSILIQWKPDHEPKQEGDPVYPKINIVAFYNKKRVFAVDTYPFDGHTNRYTIDHPDFKEYVLGAHYHVYYEEAGHYSNIGFPIKSNIKPDDLLGYWDFFCKKLNIICIGKLPLPLENDSGQIGLPL
ncbi:hypothetical protein [Xenorhabdus hominickii]|uniref:Uncharacterized protein n=1 Tax=Xenorhabdus hominickii TaxID=351679 RepID=A0A2G0Q5R6_XENHO|nr:hypothetical protein [Xenorhabdus hominickii]AOM39647.1 hypothetical protein A9255_02985 [Xenorhabdus hominickii]PHM54567.1 hypothetical protein Xhom_02510 [Xenorhabdus hominickii]